MSADHCGSSLLLALPDDVFIIVSRCLSLRDLCNLSLCCRSLYDLAFSEKVWLSQCEMLGVVAHQELAEWRNCVSSYNALCRFLFSVQPLIGIWVHQNPELGNVVYVMPGFVSVVGCRIIPQEIGPLGLEDGPLLWAPVFEIISDSDGSAAFFLHGREKDTNYFYPGLLKSVDRTCNVLSLEVEPQQQCWGGKLLHSKISRSDNEISTQRLVETHKPVVPFCRLAFGDRRKLLEVVTYHLKVLDTENGPLFPGLRDDEVNFQKDMVLLSDRLSMLMRMYKLGEGHIDWESAPGLPSDPIWMELNKIMKTLDGSGARCGFANREEGHSKNTKRRTVAGYFKDSVKQILGKSGTINDRASSRNGTSSSETKYALLHEFLRSGDTIGLSLHACTMKLSSYRAWPNMPDSRFALYKLPMRIPKAGEEYSGLWGGTFGWPPGRPAEDKPGKALFFLLLSYEVSEGQRLLIGTKILEGTHYVLHPNGSAMFIVKVDEPSLDPFPWDTDGDSIPVEVKHAYNGDGIANGYGFRYPGSKPGSLFVIQNEVLAFVWRESRAVLTLQRLDLQELLKKGERVPPLPPVANFSYLTKSYSNVFASFSNTSYGLSSIPRENGPREDLLGLAVIV